MLFSPKFKYSINPYLPRFYTSSNYNPFGSIMPGRAWSDASREYRFGFNMQEKDNEIAGNGNSYTAEYWQYDGRLGRRFNLDPIRSSWESNYSCFSNTPISNIDPLGDADYYNKRGKWIGTDGIDDDKILVATKAYTARIIKKASKQGLNISMNEKWYKDIVEIPAILHRKGINNSVEETRKSKRENGGFAWSDGSDESLFRSQEGPEATMTYNKETGKVELVAELKVFTIDSENELAEEEYPNVLFYWHVHPKVSKSLYIPDLQKEQEKMGHPNPNGMVTLRLGSPDPSDGDIKFEKEKQGEGFKGYTFVISARYNSVQYYDENGKKGLRIKLKNFLKVGKNKGGRIHKLYEKRKKCN